MKFLIRDVLWLTAVAGLALAWWLDHQRAGAEIDRLYSELVRNIKWETAVIVSRDVNDSTANDSKPAVSWPAELANSSDLPSVVFPSYIGISGATNHYECAYPDGDKDDP